MEFEKEHIKYVLPYLRESLKVEITRVFKNEIDIIISKRFGVDNIHKALDIPDFRSQYGKLFINILLPRVLKDLIKKPFVIRVINGTRYLNIEGREPIVISYFKIGELPLFPKNETNLFFIGYTKRIESLHFFGIFETPIHKGKYEKIVSDNTIISGKYFIGFNNLIQLKD